MYTITAHPDGSYTVRLPNVQALSRLLGSTAPPATQTYISNAEAHQLALEKGIELPHTTLLSACNRGNIEGAQKMGGRWRIPRQEFLKWLMRSNPDEEASLWDEQMQ